MLLGQRIKEIRISKGLEQKELAKLAGIGQSTFSEIESGKRIGIRTDILVKIAKALNVSTDYLLGLTDIPKSFDNEIPDFVKERLSKLETLESKNLKQQLLDISEKLKQIAEEM
ncbi:helix-turn-helix domain-containing protein [Marinitoga lauensis]|uniref:helix-turn-helix domain-containing protein n=1 Tax=Marinitoga lauensis TaxID=2201189 RepID=UPI00140505CF|nr:helix-turn-helix transcriptional regulator [Marinitoga lauensis]